ncbi:ATP-NAD kinase family protein [Thalassotalea agariperforans]
MSKKFKLGLIINPIAGIGGSVALKGSDGENTLSQALALGAQPQANKRAALALSVLLPYQADIEVYTVNGAMGADCASTLGFSTKVVYDTAADSEKNSSSTTPKDTEAAVQALVAEHVDIILFAGGDGTARNVCQQVSNLSSQIPVLGIPAGCKIHSGVYAVTPKAAGRVIELMVSNQLVSLMTADVMDIDESLVRQGIVKAKRFGEMTIPSELRYIQAVKSGGKESDELVLQDIAADVIDNMDDEIFIIGSGSTTEFIMTELALDNTLLGVDIIQHQAVLFHDITEAKLWQFLTEQQQKNPQQAIKLVITLIGGQGHIIGRGNQQLSPRILRLIGKENIIIVATKTKLLALNEKPLIVDSGDEALDQELSGFMPITTGYHDQVLYPVASPQ